MHPIPPAGRRHWLHSSIGVALAATLATAIPAQAQTWPDKPVRLVVGGPAGGAVDITARLLAERLTLLLGQTVLVDNKPDAAGLLGAQDLLKSPHDGSTFMVQLSGLVAEVPHVIQLPFDPMQALRPLAELNRGGLVFAANAQVPANDLKSAIAYAKAQGSKLSFASYSAGTVSHTLGAELNKLAGLDEVIWIGLWTTPDVPTAIQQKMREATLKALQDPKLRETFATLGLAVGSAATTEELQASLRSASDRQAATLQAIGFKPD